MTKIKIRLILAIFVAPFLTFGSIVYADNLGDKVNFNTEKIYDSSARTTISATLLKIGDNAYYYVDDTYWGSLSEYSKKHFMERLNSISAEFDNNIYPKETAFWGSEPKPGVDNDPRITILLEDLAKDNGGYFYSSNLYPKSVAHDSNEREMIVVSASAIENNYEKTFIAHELQHLISYNQKELIRSIEEDTWLNELRSEYTSAVIGYDSDSQAGLKSRIQTFLEKPTDSLTEWPNTPYDYAEVAMFGRYLADQYGAGILSETLKMPSVGINSINQYFTNHGINETFAGVFQKWLVANIYNDTTSNRAYGYLNPALVNVKVSPPTSTINLDLVNTIFSYTLEPWQPSWHKYYVQLNPANSIKINFSDPSFDVMYLDNLGRVGLLMNESYISNPGDLSYFVLMPINKQTRPLTLSVTIQRIVENKEMNFLGTIKDGDLIKRPNEPEMYVVEGKYKRYLSPEVIKLYGHLNPEKAIALPGNIFDSYISANYVKSFSDKRVYSIWPDGTKHWLNMSGEYFTQSGRDWNAIFTINDSEFNYYKTGTQIIR